MPRAASYNVHTVSTTISTQGRADCHDITDIAADAVQEAGVQHGIATVFTPGSTAGVTTIEFESGVVRDLQDAMRRLIPEDLPYAHHRTAGDDNGFSHVQAALLGPSVTVPIVDGRLQLGTWQQIVLVDFDRHPRQRRFMVTVLGT